MKEKTLDVCKFTGFLSQVIKVKHGRDNYFDSTTKMYFVKQCKIYCRKKR